MPMSADHSCVHVRHELLQLFFRDDLAVEQVDFALGVLGEARIVGHHADGRAFAMQVLQQFHHRFAVARVEVSGRLISQQDRRFPGQRARHGDTLLLTAGELRGIVPHAMRHAHALQRFLTRFLRSAAGMPPVGQRQFDVLVHGQIADQVETLEDEADLLVADARARSAKSRFSTGLLFSM